MNEQLEKQLKYLEPGCPAFIVGDFLRKEFEKDNQLSEDFTKNAIEMGDLWAYIVNEAQKKAKHGSCCMADAEVFGLAIHYIHDGYKEALAKKEAEAREKTKAVCKVSNVKEDDDEEPSHVTAKEIQERAMRNAAELKAQKEAEKTKVALEKQEAKRKASGQLSIFDFMNEA